MNNKKIILASASPQRKKLLKLLGVKFTVKPSNVKETLKIKTTCSALVKHNALIKSRDIANKLKEGVVVGADTLVYLGNGRIIGKPRNLAQAKKTLKILCRQPQWVYTGLAVINAKTKKTVIDYEKTKIFMLPMSDKQIENYYQRSSVSVLDKAGGFDIQGRGGLFIRRVEGCYYNVVGLPLAKLYQMLKKVGVHIFVMIMAVMISGCVTEYNLATQQQETLFYGTQKEIKLGESLSRQFDKEFKIIDNPILNERVTRIGRRIADVCDRKELVYIFKIIDDEPVNAVSLPGGYIYVFKGLLDEVENDDQLAGVIAHEIGHITAKHSIKKLQSIYGYSVLMLAAVQSGNSDLAQGVDLAFTSAFLEYSREDELLADKLAVKYAQKAGYDTQEMLKFLEKLRLIHEKEPKKKYSYWRTHPHISQRVAVLNQEISGKMEFKDYLNLTGDQ